MRLSWSEIRARAAAFAEEWRGAAYERAETQSFYNEFFEVFGVRRRRVASFEAPVKLLGERRGFLDLFWKGVLLVEQKSAGRDLGAAKTQALDYFPGLKDAELPRYLLVSDFRSFELYDLDEGTATGFALADLPRHVEAFGFIMGVQKRSFRDQDPVNIQASELMGRLHDALKTSGYAGHDLEQFLVRLLFCLFADDTGIFDERDAFATLIAERTSPDGADVGQWLAHLFEVLNVPLVRRQRTLDPDLVRFPYVNGDLFRDRLPMPAFDSAMRALLLEACEFNWEAISPAIFGALFQSVMQADERRRQGAHYTTERNILKVIEPLFLDELRAEFARLKARRDTGRERALRAFQDRLAGLTFFDPACGCGNFLIIAYRELRQLEIELLRELHPAGQRSLDVAALSKLDVDRFYGIEISEFPVRIAEVALWMMDHIMNNRLSLEFGEAYLRIPLRTAPHIHLADALELDWTKVLPPDRCSFVYGNPPFGGFVFRDAGRQRQMALLKALGAGGSRLDYVTAWFLKAAAYAQGGSPRIGFVATNSITQGEQVAQLWPTLFDRYGLEIAFAHRTFPWGSDARGKAHVHVVILGLTRRYAAPAEKRLFSYDEPDGDSTESRHPALSPYLIDASRLANPHLVVTRARAPIEERPGLQVGSKPVDGGQLILTREERDRLLALHPDARPFLRPFVGGEEVLNGGDRWLICVQEAAPEQLRRWPEIRRRIEQVRRYREREAGRLGQSLAATPAEFHVTVIPRRRFLALPEVSSERREYLPVSWLRPPAVPSNKLLICQDAPPELFALLSSRMHMAWMRAVGGRLESRYQYSSGLVYNTFPWPALTAAARRRLTVLGEAVLGARARYPAATLADLYDPDLMKPVLRRAHRAVDAAVDRLYRPAPFTDERARAEHLLALYEAQSAPALAAMAPRPRRRPS